MVSLSTLVEKSNGRCMSGYLIKHVRVCQLGRCTDVSEEVFRFLSRKTYDKLSISLESHYLGIHLRITRITRITNVKFLITIVMSDQKLSIDNCKNDKNQ